jgi:hypothetical protein
LLRLDRSIEDIIQQLERVKQRFPDDIDFNDFSDKVERGEIQVFPIGESVMVGQTHGDTVRIIAAAGVLSDILDFLPDFCDWYKDQGCRLATLGGRRGWSRFLLDMGWKYGDYEGELVKDLGL